MTTRTFASALEMAKAAAGHAASALSERLKHQESARVLAATGASQLAFLELLTQDHDVAWDRIELFHLDEYIGLGCQNSASFARYIRQRIIEPTGITRYHLLDGSRKPEDVIAEANTALSARPVDLAFVGIGENSHLAFNDPPANFHTHDPYIVVELDEACRRQQVGEGWFRTLEDVPRQAISISIQQILSTREILCIVPDHRKAQAVKDSVESQVTPAVPASILQTHPNTTIYLDQESASLLSADRRTQR
jgi:glucosamine-6-phosphate deaminase